MARNNKGKKMKILLSKADGLKINGGLLKKKQPQTRLMQDYGVPEMRPCSFPSDQNPVKKHTAKEVKKYTEELRKYAEVVKELKEAKDGK